MFDDTQSYSLDAVIRFNGSGQMFRRLLAGSQEATVQWKDVPEVDTSFLPSRDDMLAMLMGTGGEFDIKTSSGTTVRAKLPGCPSGYDGRLECDMLTKNGEPHTMVVSGSVDGEGDTGRMYFDNYIYPWFNLICAVGGTFTRIITANRLYTRHLREPIDNLFGMPIAKTDRIGQLDELHPHSDMDLHNAFDLGVLVEHMKGLADNSQLRYAICREDGERECVFYKASTAYGVAYGEKSKLFKFGKRRKNGIPKVYESNNSGWTYSLIDEAELKKKADEEPDDEYSADNGKEDVE